jgi:hypothetical protein
MKFHGQAKPTRWARAALLLTLLGLFLSLGCKRRRDEANKQPTRLIVGFKTAAKLGSDRVVYLGDNDLANATLVVDGREAGVLTADAEGPSIVIELPEGKALYDRSLTLALRLPTPCGTYLDVALPDYGTNLTSPEDEARALRGEVGMRAEIRLGETPIPVPFAVWVDDVGQEKALVEVGSVKVEGRVPRTDGKQGPMPGRQMNLWGFNCAPSHEVKVDGKLVGQVTPATSSKGILISTEAGRCYVRQVHRYASQYDSLGGGTSDYEVPRGQAVAMPWGSFDYFLRSAPASVEGPGSTTRSALERTECTTPAKGKAK